MKIIQVTPMFSTSSKKGQSLLFSCTGKWFTIQCICFD